LSIERHQRLPTVLISILIGGGRVRGNKKIKRLTNSMDFGIFGQMIGVTKKKGGAPAQ